MRIHGKVTVLVAIAILVIAGCTGSQVTSGEDPATSTVAASSTIEKAVTAVEKAAGTIVKADTALEPVAVPSPTRESEKIYPTRIPLTKTPPPTKIPPPTATWDPASDFDTQTVVATAVLTATPAPTTTPVPEPPPYHFLTAEEVEAALEEVGCSGWKQVQIGEIIYNRVCANDDNYAVNVLGAMTAVATPTPATSSDSTASGNESEGCKDATDSSVPLTTAPTDLSLVRSIVPPGSPSAETIAGHSYIHNKNAVPGESMRVPVYAVADSTLDDLAYYISGGGEINFYFLLFGVTCEIGYMFDHIVDVVPKIAAVAPTTASVSSGANEVRTTVAFEAGELIGYVGEGTWDFGASDTTHINQFANQSRYVGTAHQGALHQICPYDYYDEPLNSQFYGLFGDPGGTLAAVDHCNPARDVLGSAAGQWFDALDYETGRRAVGIAMLPGDLVEISTVASGLRVPNNHPTWLDPELITSSHCYESDGLWFYPEIQDAGMQMALASGSGTCPGSMPADAAIYYR